MKKEFLLTVASGLLFSSSALAQSCVSTPNCETLGYTETEADCTDGKILKCPFDLSKIFCYRGDGDNGVAPEDATPGMIYYSDGTFSEDVIAGKTPVGVVAYNKDGHRFVVALEGVEKAWGGNGSDVACLPAITSISDAILDFSGKENTQCMLSDTQSHPAAEYCNSYKAVDRGKGADGWYLPAAGELYVVYPNYDVVNAGLQKLSKTQILNSYYWSSSEGVVAIYSAWIVNPSSGNASYDHKYDYEKNWVRCVLAF